MTTTPQVNRRAYSVAEVAAMYGMTEPAVRDLISDELLIAFNVNSGRRRTLRI